MKVKKISIKNIKAIDQQEVTFNGCTAIITGGNNKGKSTLLKTLPERIRGIKPEKILKEGTENGETTREFTDNSKIIRKIDGDKEKFTYVSPDGLEVKTGVIKYLCDKYFGKGFDIDLFLQASPKEQKQILQSLVGLDFDSIDREYKSLYESRREANTIAKMEEAKCVEVEFVESVDLSEIQNKIEDGQKINMERQKILSNIEMIEIAIDADSKQIEELIKKIEVLKNAISLNNQKKIDFVEKIKDVQEVCISDLQEKFEYGLLQNQKAQESQKAHEQRIVATEARDKANKIDEQLHEVEDKKNEMIKNANLPDGFSFDDDGVVYNGQRLSKQQQSSSAIYIAGLKLASMNIGELQTLFFDASYLDRKSLEDIEKRAEEKGLQLLIERPDFDGGEIRYEIIQ